MDMLSIVVPCYNEQEALPIFYRAVSKVAGELKEVRLEIIFVNDGSRDKSLEEMKALAQKDSRVKYVSFSRNFGKEAAMYAGFRYAKGD